MATILIGMWLFQGQVALPAPETPPAPPHTQTVEQAEAAQLPPTRERGLLPAVAVVVPGLLLHGSGHYAAGERKTAWSLLRWQGLGLATMLASGAGLGLTGASRKTVEVFALGAVMGSSLLLATWLADVYGVLAPEGGTGSPMRTLPLLEASVGVLHVSDPTLSGDLLFGPAFNLRLGRWRASPGAWVASSGQNMRFEGALAYRFIGPQTNEWQPSRDGSFFDLVVGTFHHRYRETTGEPIAGRFNLTNIDVRLEARLDLQRMARTLTGSFVEATAGAGMGAYNYPVSGTTEASEVLVGGFGYGLYWGRRPGRHGQAKFFYNHRHDQFAGGLKMPGLGSGVLGYFGLEGFMFFTRSWGVRAEVQAGSAIVTGLALIHRYGKVSL